MLVQHVICAAVGASGAHDRRTGREAGRFGEFRTANASDPLGDHTSTNIHPVPRKDFASAGDAGGPKSGFPGTLQLLDDIQIADRLREGTYTRAMEEARPCPVSERTHREAFADVLESDTRRDHARIFRLPCRMGLSSSMLFGVGAASLFSGPPPPNGAAGQAWQSLRTFARFVRRDAEALGIVRYLAQSLELGNAGGQPQQRRVSYSSLIRYASLVKLNASALVRMVPAWADGRAVAGIKTAVLLVLGGVHRRSSATPSTSTRRPRR
jgi:hypothetical protein